MFTLLMKPRLCSPICGNWSNGEFFGHNACVNIGINFNTLSMVSKGIFT